MAVLILRALGRLGMVMTCRERHRPSGGCRNGNNGGDAENHAGDKEKNPFHLKPSRRAADLAGAHARSIKARNAAYGGEVQSAVAAGSGAGWLEGRSEVGRLEQGRGGEAVGARDIFNRHRAVLQDNGRGMDEAMTAMRRRRSARRLCRDIAARLRDRNSERTLVAVDATAMEQ